MDLNTREKRLNKTHKVTFDDSKFPKALEAISLERSIDLENSLGKVLLERFQSEFKKKGIK